MNKTTTVTLTATVTMTVDTDDWRMAYGLAPVDVPADARSWLEHQLQDMSTASDVRSTFTTELVTPKMFRIDGTADVDTLVHEIVARANGAEVHTVIVDPRRDGVAFKVNGGMWTAPLGQAHARG